MKKLLNFPLLILLAGCVTYYYPESALEDGVYYAGDDPSYVLNSADYSGVVYYPWVSLDYFYLGYWPYPGNGFVYGYPYGRGYSPWGYPYGFYGYYSPRYFSYHHAGFWWPDRGYCSRHGYCNGHSNRYRYSLQDPGHGNSRDRDDEYPQDQDNVIHRNSGSSPAHYVTTPPPGYAGNQGMVIRSSESSKIGTSRVEPAQQTTPKPVSAGPSTTGVLSSPSAIPSSTGTRNSRSSVVSARGNRGSSGKRRGNRNRDRD